MPNIMRKEHLNTVSEDIPFVENLIFHTPLTEGDLTDHVSGVSPTPGTGGCTWDSAYDAYRIFTTAEYQHCLIYNIPDGIDFKSSENYNFSIYTKIFINSYNGTIDYAILYDGINWPTSNNSYSIGETHRYNTSTDNPITKNAWHEICMARYEDNTFFYVDKALSRTTQTSQYAAFNISDAVAKNKHKNLAVGTSIYNYKFNIYIKDLRIYDRALSASEIVQL